MYKEPAKLATLISCSLVFELKDFAELEGELGAADSVGERHRRLRNASLFALFNATVFKEVEGQQRPHQAR